MMLCYLLIDRQIILFMGNQIEIDKKQKIEVKVVKSKHNKQNKCIALPTLKVQFHYVHPISKDQNFQDVIDLEEHDTPPINISSEKISLPSQNQNIQYSEYSKNGILQIQKISVSWNLFVKIKKKNYLEDYVFIKEIGKGAYGQVSKVKMKYGGLFRAAKIIKNGKINSDNTLKQKVLAEVRIPMKLDHPNINKLYQVFEWRNQLILINDLCEGGDLFQRIKKQKNLSQKVVAEFMKQILSGVVYLHKNKIMHRDLKPQNMLYDISSSNLKIIDFGTAIQFQDHNLKELVGTPYYVAPEVIKGQYNQKCDVWSCGIILYVLLSGCPPFLGKDQKQIMKNVVNQTLSFSSSIWKSRSKYCKNLILSMLNRNVNLRISALEALNSQWMINTPTESQNQNCNADILSNLKNFHFKNKLKAVVFTYIASQLYSNKDKQVLLKVFRSIDKDGDGVIQKSQLFKVFNNYSQSNLTEQQLENIVQTIDTNGSGLIDFTEFLVAASKQSELVEKERLENAFSYLDTDHSGYITIDEVRQFLDDSNETAQQIKKIFEEVDKNGDGMISKKQFVYLLTRNN